MGVAATATVAAGGAGAGVETRPPNNLARAGGRISGTTVGSTGGEDVKPGIFRFAKVPFPILLRVAKSKAVSTGGVTRKFTYNFLSCQTFSNKKKVIKKKERSKKTWIIKVCFIKNE